jgi:ribosome-associated protein
MTKVLVLAIVLAMVPGCGRLTRMKRARRDSFDGDAADGAVSKSARKREAEQLQALGRALTELKAADLDALAEQHPRALPEKLRQAIADYQRFPSHGARRRQLQFIGRLMRDIDPEPLQAALDTLHGQSAQARYEFHQLEHWRERLLAEPEALTDYLNEHPGVDAQQLRQRIADVHKAGSEEGQRRAARALFRFLREAAHPV